MKGLPVVCSGVWLCCRADVSPAVVEEHEVGPLPLPTASRPIVPSQWRSPIPFTARAYNSETENQMWDKFLCSKLTYVNSVLSEVTGYTFSLDCQQHCLTYRSNNIGAIPLV